MISKRNTFSNRGFRSKAFEFVEVMAAECVMPLMWAGVTSITFIAIQASMNQRVKDSCPINISELILTKSVLGDTYACVSRQLRYGPAAPLPD